MSIGLRTIEDLKQQYALAPELADVFVEGRHDQSRYRWLLPRLGCGPDIQVYEIQSVDVPADVVAKHKQALGNRGRLIALAKELASVMPVENLRVCCVADADADYLLGRIESVPGLVYTDGTSPETYAFCERTLAKFFAVCLGDDSIVPAAVLASIEPILQELQALRAANESLGWGMQWIESLNTISVTTGTSLQFDRDAYVRTYLQQNGQWASRAEFETRVEAIRRRTTTDVTKRIRGHDFAPLLVRALQNKLDGDRRGFKNPFVLERTLMGCIETADLQDKPMIKALVDRVSKCTGNR